LNSSRRFPLSSAMVQMGSGFTEPNLFISTGSNCRLRKITSLFTKRVVETEKLNWSTIRTFDLGGDKFLSDPKLAKEMKPTDGPAGDPFLS